MNAEVNITSTQIQASRSFNLFGKRALVEVAKYLNKLDKGAMLRKKFISEINPYVMSSSDKYRLLGAVNLINHTRDRTIEGRTSENGSKKRRYLSEGEIIPSPNVLLEALLTTLIIDTNKEIYVAKFDVPRSYLHANMPEGKMILLKLQGQFADIIHDINP